MSERLTKSLRNVYNKGEPIKCECGRAVAVKDEEGNIIVKCRVCGHIIKVFRAK